MADAMANAYVYILASRPRGALYVGVTNDLVRRVWEHKSGLGSAHVRRYFIHRLVWVEEHDLIAAAIGREKSIKRWERAMKFSVIEEGNPTWRDLYQEIAGP